MRSLYFSTWTFVLAAAVIVALGVVAIPAVEAGQKVSQPTGLTLLDSQGKTIGPFYPSTSASCDFALIKLADGYVVAQVDNLGFCQHSASSAAMEIRYSEPNCQGDVLLHATYRIAPELHIVGTNGYYVVTSEATDVTSPSGGLPGRCNNYDPPYPTFWGGVARTVDLSGFAGPFSIK